MTTLPITGEQYFNKYSQVAPQPRISQKYLHKLAKEKNKMNIDSIQICELIFDEDAILPSFLLGANKSTYRK